MTFKDQVCLQLGISTKTPSAVVRRIIKKRTQVDMGFKEFIESGAINKGLVEVFVDEG